MSNKDREVDTREQVLNVLIACWWYRPNNPSSLPSTCAWLKHSTSMAVLGEKLKRDPRTTQSGWGVESRALFLRSSASVQSYWRPHERLLYMDHMRYVWSRVIHGPSVKSVWLVDRVFPYGVYIDLNHCDSRIWATTCSWLTSSSNLLD
jgi:hypothetical protein